MGKTARRQGFSQILRLYRAVLPLQFGYDGISEQAARHPTSLSCMMCLSGSTGISESGQNFNSFFGVQNRAILGGKINIAGMLCGFAGG